MIGQKILPFRGGDVSVINNREPHLARSAEGTTSKWSWILLDTQKLIGPAFPELELLDPSVLCGDRFRNIISNSDDPEIAPLMKILIRELEMKKDGYRMTVRGIVISIMSKLHRLVKKEQVDGTPQNSTDSMERVGPALKAIIGGYHRKQSVSNLASKCGMSVANFRRIFLEATGLPRPNIC